MNNVVNFEPPPPAEIVEPSPSKRAIRRWSRAFSRLFALALLLFAGFALLLGWAVFAYDGPFLSFGPGGIWIGRAPDTAMGLMPLTAFSPVQRICGALAVGFLAMPIIFILLHLRALFRLYAEGIVFAPANARRLRLAGLGLILYAFAPFVADRMILIAGVTNDPAWLHFDEALALLLGALFFVGAHVAAFGREIEQERDTFV